MDSEVFFLNMFSAYEPPEHLKTVLSQAAIAAANIDPAERSVSVQLNCPAYISAYDLDMVSAEIAKIYGLSNVILEPVFPPSALKKLPAEVLTAFFMAQDSMAIASLAGAKWEWDGDTLHIYLVGNG